MSSLKHNIVKRIVELKSEDPEPSENSSFFFYHRVYFGKAFKILELFFPIKWFDLRIRGIIVREHFINCEALYK